MCHCSVPPQHSLLPASYIHVLYLYIKPCSYIYQAGETGCLHGHAKDLLLKDGDAEGALQDGLEAGMDIVHRLTAVSAFEVGVNEATGYGSWTDDGYLNDQVVEPLWVVSRQRRHLSPALDLKYSNGVGGAQHCVGRRVVWW